MDNLVTIPLFINIRLLDIIDVFMVAALLYLLYKLIKGTVAINIFLGILALYLFWKLVTLFQMELLSELLGQFISVGVIALIIVFQQEIRKFLLLLGNPKNLPTPIRKLFAIKKRDEKDISDFIIDLVGSLTSIVANRHGAIIVICQSNKLYEFIQTGIELNATFSPALTEAIFYGNNPLHDGAVIIDQEKIKAAKCILPVSGNRSIPDSLGLRHRAGLGITEQSDALAIIVSEENGTLSYSLNGKLKYDVKPGDMKRLLSRELKKN